MRRWLAIFLLVFMPLQLSWAAVTVYCTHETASDTQHFGHHDHQHKAGADQGDADQKAVGDIDYDCSACHAACAAVILDFARPVPAAQSSFTIAWLPDSPTSALSAQPERPKWAALA